MFWREKRKVFYQLKRQDAELWLVFATFLFCATLGRTFRRKL